MAKRKAKQVGSILPTEKSSISTDLLDNSFLLYGPPKIGKTTFISEIDNVLILDTEVGTKNLEVYDVQIDSWDTFRKVVTALKGEDHSYNTVAIDTIDRLYIMCMKYCGKIYGFEHPSDAEYGKGWEQLRTEFLYVLAVLSNIPELALWMVSHSKEVQITTRTQSTTKTQCTLPGAGRGVVIPMVDIMLYCGYTFDEEGNEVRAVTAKPTHDIEAGDKTHGHRLLRHGWIPLKYKALVEAYENEVGNVDFQKYYGSGSPKKASKRSKRRK